MKKIINISILAFSLVLVACSEKDKVSGDTELLEKYQVPTELDAYIQKFFTQPYNTDILYRFEDIESDMSFNLVPASYEKSVKMTNVIRYLCIEPYAKVVSEQFLKETFPKQLMFIGSPGYKNNGTMTLGTAISGRKIVLYDINDIGTSTLQLEEPLRTIFHESSHILHQRKEYTNKFNLISGSEYTAGKWNEAWGSGSDAVKKARQAGFITPYGSSEPNEDFVELIAHYIVYSDARWEAMLKTAAGGSSTTAPPNPPLPGRAIIEQKIQIVKDYMKNTWNFDLDAMRAEVQTRMQNWSSYNLDNLDVN